MRAAGLRRLAVGAGWLLWGAAGVFTAWAGLFLALHWGPEPAEHRRILEGLVLVGTTAAGWVSASRRLVGDARHAAAAPVAGPPTLRPDLAAPTPESDRRPVLSARRSRLPELPPPGDFELCMLRRRPQLTGGPAASVAPPAIELLARLALGGGEASRAALADDLGRDVDPGAIGKQLAALEAATGVALVSPGADGEGYRLSPLVTCDLLRWRAAVAAADEASARRDVAAEIAALSFALDLLGDGVPGGDWSERDSGERIAEQVANEVHGGVRRAAARLGCLAASLGDLDLVVFALERGRRLDPYDPGLARLAALLAAG